MAQYTIRIEFDEPLDLTHPVRLDTATYVLTQVSPPGVPPNISLVQDTLGDDTKMDLILDGALIEDATYNIQVVGAILSAAGNTINPSFDDADLDANFVVPFVTQASGRYPQHGMGLQADDLEPFVIPCFETDCIVVELTTSAAGGFQLGEELHDLSGTPSLRGQLFATSDAFLLTIRNVQADLPAVGATLTGADSSWSAVVKRVWDRNEYMVPNMSNGRYSWIDNMLRDDYLLRIYYTGTVDPSDTYVLDDTYSPPRFRASVSAIVTGTLNYIDVIPQPQLQSRSQPELGQALECSPSTNVVTVRSESWAVQWRPGPTKISDKALVINRTLERYGRRLPRFPRKGSTNTGDSVIIDAIGVR